MAQQDEKALNREEKLKALEAAIVKLEKDYGKGAVMKLGDGASMNVETVPTGSLSLDIALGLGGIPKGRVIEIYGPESSGKTTVALHMVAEVQKRGGIAGFIDAEHALDPVYAKNIGVDIDNLYISQPDNGEQATGDRRDHGTFRRSGHYHCGLCGSSGSEGGDRRRYGRQPCRSAGQTDVPGAEKADRYHQQVQLYGDLYQPAA